MKQKLGILCKILYAIALGALVPPEALLPAPVWAAIAQAPRGNVPGMRPAFAAAAVALPQGAFRAAVSAAPDAP